ncbi:MAG: hypothetical protein U5L11_02955 [Arhodomonas sp.]|nr:hypothetical protein [Arhodomonas sp.]
MLLFPRLALRLLTAALLALVFVTAAPAQQEGGVQQESSVRQADYAALADILADEHARERLIGELRRLAEGEGETTTPEAAPPGIARQIAGLTAAAAESVGERLAEAAATVRALAGADSEAAPLDLDSVARAAMPVVVLIVATLVAFAILHRAATPVFRACARAAERRPGVLHRALSILLAMLADLAMIAVIALGACALALYALGEGGSLPAWGSLFHQRLRGHRGGEAAVSPGAVPRGGCVAAATPHRGGGSVPLPPRCPPVGAAGLWPARGRAPGCPALRAAPGRLATLLVSLAAYVYVLRVIFRYRGTVAAGLRGEAVVVGGAVRRLRLGVAGIWHWLAAAYVTVLFVGGQVDPAGTLVFVLGASAWTLIVVLVAVLLVEGAGWLARRPIRLSETMQRRLPLLEHRLNAYVPTALKVVRGAVVVIAVAALVHLWGLLDLTAWLASAAGMTLLGTLAGVALTLLVAGGAWMVVASLPEHRLNPNTAASAEPRRRPCWHCSATRSPS